MEEIELIGLNKEESDRFFEWLVLNNLRLDHQSANFWWDSPQAEAQLSLVCCEDNEISVHVRHGEGDEQGPGSEFHAIAPFDPHIIERSEDVVVFIERLTREFPAKISISWFLLRQVANSWVITPKFFPLLLPQSFKTRRESSAGLTAQQIGKEVEGEICASFYHCQELSPRKVGETTRWETHRVVVYNQAIGKYCRWILIGPASLNELHRGILTRPWSPYKQDPRYWRCSGFILIAYIAACSWQSMLNNIEDQLFLEDSRPDNTRPIKVLYELQNQLSLAGWQIKTNIGVLKFIMGTPQRKYVEDLTEHLSASLEDLTRQKVRVDFLSREARNVIEEVSQGAGQVHNVKMETFSWHNLKMNYAIESGTRQTTIICFILVPAIFTSTFFSTNFFSQSEDGAISATPNLWIWFAIAIPLTTALLLLVWLFNELRTRRLVRGSLSEKISTIFRLGNIKATTSGFFNKRCSGEAINGLPLSTTHTSSTAGESISCK